MASPCASPGSQGPSAGAMETPPMPGHMPTVSGAPILSALSTASTSTAASAGTPRSEPKEGPSQTVVPTAQELELEALRDHVAVLEAKLCEAEKTRQMWEACMTSMVGAILLGPEMNDMYKHECSSLLTQALTNLEQIDRVRYVDCSFPSVPSEAPRLSLDKWNSLSASEWQLRWSPSWSIQIAVEGSHYVAFRMILRIHSVQLAGTLRVNSTKDLRTIRLSFVEQPQMRMCVDCTIAWGSLPLPLQDYIGDTVVGEFRAWFNKQMVQPNELVLTPSAFQPKSTLTDADVEKAMRAATLARELSELNVS